MTRIKGLGRALLIAKVATFAVPVLSLAVILIADFDPAPTVSWSEPVRLSDGSVTLLLGDCAGGELQRSK